jgi:hypothetical protein
MPHGAGGVRSRTERLGQARLDQGNTGEADTGELKSALETAVAPRSIESAEVQARLSRACSLECAETGDALDTVRFQTKFAAAILSLVGPSRLHAAANTSEFMTTLFLSAWP